MTRQRLRIDDGLDGRAWLFQAQSWPTRLMHRHDEPELNLITRGSAGYLVDGQRYTLASQTLIWLLPGQNHLLMEESRDFEMWIAVFRRPMLRRLVRHGGPPALLARRPSQPFCHPLRSADAGRLKGLLGQAAQACQDGDTALHNAAMAHLAIAGWRMQEQAGRSHQGQEVHPAVEQAAMLIRQSPQEADLADIARRSGLSLSRLTRLFRSQMGLPMVQFRQQERLRRFIDALGQGRRRNITQAALEAGFGSYPQFHRVFTQIMGCSPQAYLRTIRQHAAWPANAMGTRP